MQQFLLRSYVEVRSYTCYLFCKFMLYESNHVLLMDVVVPSLPFIYYYLFNFINNIVLLDLTRSLMFIYTMASPELNLIKI